MQKNAKIREVHSELGLLIRDYRVKAGLTQMDLARKLGYDSAQFVSLFERGVSKVPLEVVGALISIIGLPEREVIQKLLAAYEETLTRTIHSGKKKVSSGSR